MNLPTRTGPTAGEVGADLIEDIVACLEAGTPVRRDLAGGGRLHIDRAVPFLCVHSIGKENAIAARDVTTANAAYLIAPDLSHAVSVINAVGQAMVRRFGAFIAIEIAELERDRLLAPDSPYLPRFETLVVLQDRRAVRAAADAFAATLENAEVKYRSPKVESRIRGAEEKGWFTQIDDALSQIGIAFAPIYRQPKTEKIYPDLRKRVVATMFDALLRAVASFVAASGGVRPSTHRAFGRRMFVDTIERVDRRLDGIAKSFDFLLATTPINADAAWGEFSAKGFANNPRLLYRPLTIEIDTEKRRLYSVPFENLEDPLLLDLYRQKQTELDLQLTMIAARETRQFREASRVLYGPVEPGLRNAAESILATNTGEDPVPEEGADEKTADCHLVRREAHRMIRSYRGDMRFSAVVSLRSDLPAGLMVSGPRLLISRSTRMPRRRVEALLSHEIGVHLFTYFSGDAQGLRLFRSGLAGYEGAQEGLAVFAEYLVGGMTVARLRLIAARVVGCVAMLDGAEFCETFRLLTRDYGLSNSRAFDVTLRLHRSGGLAKDAIYLRGLLEVLNHVKQNGSLAPFWMGKIATEHFPMMEELHARGLLKAPPILPAFLAHPEAGRRLAAARAGMSPKDMIAA